MKIPIPLNYLDKLPVHKFLSEALFYGIKNENSYIFKLFKENKI